MNKDVFRCSLCDAKSTVSFINTWRCNEGSHWTLQCRNGFSVKTDLVVWVFSFFPFFFFDPCMFWLEMSLQWTPISMTQSGTSALEIKSATTKAMWIGLNTHVLQERKLAVERETSQERSIAKSNQSKHEREEGAREAEGERTNGKTWTFGY